MAIIDVENFGVKYPPRFEPIEIAEGENLAAQPDVDTWHDLPAVTASAGNTAVQASHLLINPITPVEQGFPGPSALQNL